MEEVQHRQTTPEQVRGQAPPCFTKEQTEALKRFVGMDEFYPNMWEVKNAGDVFRQKLTTILPDILSGDTSINGAINIAAVEVWKTARRYQSDKCKEHSAKETAQTATRLEKFKKLFHFLPIKAHT